jgi:hypothetical protein
MGDRPTIADHYFNLEKITKEAADECKALHKEVADQERLHKKNQRQRAK